jgi:hypothetical protein
MTVELASDGTNGLPGRVKFADTSSVPGCHWPLVPVLRWLPTSGRLHTHGRGDSLGNHTPLPPCHGHEHVGDELSGGSRGIEPKVQGDDCEPSPSRLLQDGGRVANGARHAVESSDDETVCPSSSAVVQCPSEPMPSGSRLSRPDVLLDPHERPTARAARVLDGGSLAFKPEPRLALLGRRDLCSR